MTIQPRNVDDIYTTLRDNLKNKTSKLTNFAETSFNYVWTRAWSRDIQEQEEKIVAALLAGWPDYAGKELTEEDFQDLGIDYDPDKINEYMKDEHLDQLGYLVGEKRYQGQRATGEVTFDVDNDTVRIYEGTSVGTQPGADGEFLEFQVDADGDGEIEGDAYVTPSAGSTQVTVDVIAEEVGGEYNVGAGQLTYMPNPPVGVLGVTNNAATTGGDDEQDNDDFRRDIKNAVSRSSGGGTTAGIEGYLEANVTGVDDGDVILEEFVDQQPPFVDVIVDGGSDNDIQNAIDNSRPAGIKHNLVRPEVQQIDVFAEVEGTDINKSKVEQQVNDYLLALGLGDNFFGDEIITRIMEADDDVQNIAYLELKIPAVTHETITYDGSGTSLLEIIYRDGGLARQITDEDGNTYQKGTDYAEIDLSGDGILDGIDWSIGGVSPSSGTEFYVDYYSEKDFTFQSGTAKYSVEGSPTGNTVVVDENDNEYSSSAYQFNDTDGDGLNDEIEWTDTSVIGDGDEFFVKYGEPQGVDEVYDEEHTYQSGQSVYTLNDEPIESDLDDTIRDETGATYSEGTDYEYVDDDGDQEPDSVDWSIGGSSPSDGDVFYVTYRTEPDQTYENRQKADPSHVQVTVQ